jgi:hypothetical protein
MKTTSPSMIAVVDRTDDDIRAYAYHLYEQSGCLPGRDLDNWLEAKASILANIPAHTSHTRLYQHLQSSSTTTGGAHRFALPASDAALPDLAGAKPAVAAAAHKPARGPRNPNRNPINGSGEGSGKRVSS